MEYGGGRKRGPYEAPLNGNGSFKKSRQGSSFITPPCSRITSSFVTPSSMAASTEIALSPHTYDVFLSFRGTDTRTHFTDHLYTALKQAGFHTFRDDDELPRGEDIEAELKKAIRESKISVIVFSKDYASSTWCLDELVMIMKKMSAGGHTVLPIFYDVPPTHVRNQTGSFASSFNKHKEKFKTQTDKINQWRDALIDATKLAGMELNVDRYESHFIQDVVREISNKLHPGKLDLTPHLVGTNLRVEIINSWLQDEAHDASMAIIYGIGGVGKTTIAKIVYNENLERFDSSSFIANVRDLSKKPKSLIRLQNQLLSDILKGKIHEVCNVDDGIVKIQNAICCKKVLIIFDDVDESGQLDALLGRQMIQFFPGSKIILTTRNEGLLGANKAFEKFQIKGLDEKDSLQLFSLHAFGQHHPIDSYLECSMEAVYRCEGLPLALEVFGSSLFDRNIDFWKDALRKLKNFPDSKIQRILRISYDSLKDDHDQYLFLDIACFFVGMEKNYVSGILNGCGFHTLVGIQNLVERCLLSVNEDNELRMHQLLIEMGREIVRQESTNDPGRRSRLWDRRDACTVLQDKTGTKEIRGLVLDLYRLVESSYGSTNTDLIYEEHESASSHSFPLDLQTFVKMRNILFLQLYGVNVKGNYEDLPRNLVLLCWHGFPLRSIPSNFHLKKLVSLDLSYSDIKKIWDGTMVLPGLKFLNLSHCRKLTRMPNFGGLPCLERLIFTGCIRIFEVDESITCLKKLLILNLKDCTSLQRFPKKFSILDSLEEINLSGCSNLYEPLKIFLGSGTAINRFLSTTTSTVARTLSLLSSTLWHPTIQSSLTLRKRLRSTNFSLASLPSSLVRLSLEHCNLYDDAFPNFSNLRSLAYLNLSGNPFHDLPEGISNRNMLWELVIDGCTGIQSLPKLPINLFHLWARNCSSLERLEGCSLSEVKFTEFELCDKLVSIQDWFKIYSINDIDKAILKSLGFSDLESLADVKVDMFNELTRTTKTTSLQVLHEHGVLNIFLPGDDVPSCFTLQVTGNRIGFNILPVAGHKIYGLNVCISYAKRIKSVLQGHFLQLDMKNITKDVWWRYNPTCFGISRYEEETIQWLSHWKAGDLLEVGDQVDILVRGLRGFDIKNCAVSLVYEADTKSAEEIIGDLALDQIPLDSGAAKRSEYDYVALGLRRLGVEWT